MMAELSPAGFNNMVRLTDSFLFSSRGLQMRTQPIAVLRPVRAVELCIVHDRAKRDPGNKSDNNRDGFPFPFALCTSASLVIWFTTDVQK